MAWRLRRPRKGLMENASRHDFWIFGPTINGLLGLFKASLWLIYGLFIAYIHIYHGLEMDFHTAFDILGNFENLTNY